MAASSERKRCSSDLSIIFTQKQRCKLNFAAFMKKIVDSDLYIYNSLSRKKEKFVPINPPFTGMYVCGPTVYGDPHLGHARAAITFDVIYRYLNYLGYKVRYVRNITDVGHLEEEVTEEGEDKILKKARLEEVEPIEIEQRSTGSYRKGREALNCLRRVLEPTSTRQRI